MENQDSSSTTEQVPVETLRRSVLSDHQLEVDGVIYRKLTTINRVIKEVFLQITNN
jgi:hypothetical protein